MTSTKTGDRGDPAQLGITSTIILVLLADVSPFLSTVFHADDEDCVE